MRKILMVFAIPFAAAAFGQTSGGGTTVNDGAYNREQAKRGRAASDDKCATCHDGGTLGPELWGDAFRTHWAAKTAGAFCTRIQETMPEDDPGSLSKADVLSIIAYVFQMNEFPAGADPIASASARAG